MFLSKGFFIVDRVLCLLCTCNTTNITQVQAQAGVTTKMNGYIRVVEWSWSS